MASVTEFSLQDMATKLAKKFNAGEGSLNDIVTQAIKESSYNKDQAARLIERTNTEAFLSRFPNSNSFDVANPDVILGMFGEGTSSTKVASQSSGMSIANSIAKETNMLVKEASYNCPSKTASAMMNADIETVFGIDVNEKTASYDSYDNGYEAKKQVFDSEYSRLIKEATLRDASTIFYKTDESLNKVWKLYKTAAILGYGTDVAEEKLLISYPENTESVFKAVDMFNTKLASDMSLPAGIVKRAMVSKFNPLKVVDRDELTDAFGELISYGF